MPGLLDYVPTPVPVEEPPLTAAPPASAPAPAGGGLSSYGTAPPAASAPTPQPEAPSYMIDQTGASAPSAAAPAPATQPDRSIERISTPGDAIGAGLIGAAKLVEDHVAPQVSKIPGVGEQLRGAGIPLAEAVTTPGNLIDKGLTALSVYDRPAQGAREQRGKEALAIVEGESPQTEFSDVAAHPERFLQTVGRVGMTVLGANPLNAGEDEDYYTWVEQNPDLVKSLEDDPEQIYEEWKRQTGRTWETGGLIGAAKGIGYDAINDPLLPASMALGRFTSGLSTAAIGARGAMTARGLKAVSNTAKVANTALNPEDILLGPAAKGLKSLVSPSEETRRGIQRGALGEVARTITEQRVPRGTMSQPTLATEPLAPQPLALPAPALVTPPPTGPVVPQPSPNGFTPPPAAPTAPTVIDRIRATPPAQRASVFTMEDLARFTREEAAARPAPTPRATTPGGLPVTVGRGPYGVERHTVGDWAIDHRRMPNGEMRWVARHKSVLGKSKDTGKGGLLQGTPLAKGRSFSTLDDAYAFVDGAKRKTSTNGAPAGSRPTPGTPADGGVPFGGRRAPAPSDKPPLSRFAPGAPVRHANDTPLRDTDYAGFTNELIETRPEVLERIDLALATGQPIPPELERTSLLRQALEQNREDKGRPYLADDWPDERRPTKDGDIARKRGGGDRYVSAVAERVRRYDIDEVTYRVREMLRWQAANRVDPYFPQRWDNKRKALRDAIKRGNYEGEVNFGRSWIWDDTLHEGAGGWARSNKEIVKEAVRGNTLPPIHIRDFDPSGLVDLPPAAPNPITGEAVPANAFTPETPPQPVATTIADEPTPPSTGAVPTPEQTAPFKKARKAPTRKTPAGTHTPPTTGRRARVDDPDPYDNLIFPDSWRDTLDLDVGGKTIFRHITDNHDDVHKLVEMEKIADLSPSNVKERNALRKRYEADYRAMYQTEPDFAHMQPREIALFAADVATKRWFDSLPPLQKKKAVPILSGVGEVSRGTADFVNSVNLYNWAAFPTQTSKQWFGNALMLAMFKPSAALGMLNPRKMQQVWLIASEERKGIPPGQRMALTDTQATVRDMGLSPYNQMVTAHGKTAMGFGDYKPGNSFARAAKQVLAPQFLADLVGVPDAMLRDNIFSAAFFPAARKIQKDYGNRAAGLAQEWTRSKGLGHSIPAPLVKKAIDEAFASKRGRFRVSTAKATDLESAVSRALESAPGIDEATKRNFANRVARNYQELLNNEYQAAADEVKRLAFSWDATRADDAMRHIVGYHYWSTRAGALYAKELAKNPAMAANWYRLAEATAEEAETLQYPHWLQGAMRLAGSPLGSVLWMRPLDMIGTMLTFADWQYGEDPRALQGDLTALGRARGLVPFRVNPLWDSVAWGLGLYGGEDARPSYNPLGFEQIPRLGNQLINAANHAGLLGDFFKDEAGNPVVLPERPITDLVAKFASAVGGIVREDAQPIPNLFASQTASVHGDLVYVLADAHPDWTEDQVTREAFRMLDEVEAGMAASDEVLEAQQMTVLRSLQGPLLDTPLPDGLEGFVSAAARFLSPAQIINRPETLMAARTDPVPALGRDLMNLPEFTDEFDAYDLGGFLYDTPRVTELGINDEDWWGDPALKEAAATASAIYYGDLDEITVDGVRYEKDDLYALSDNARGKLSRAYLAEQGFSQADVDAMKATRTALEEGNADLAGFKGYTDYLRDYEGGVEAFAEEAYRTSPSFARYMDNVPEEHGTPEWAKYATYKEAYIALQGERTGTYDPLTIPPAGEIPGVSDVGQFATDRAETREEYEPYTATIEKQINELYYAQKLLDQTYPGYGLRVGAGNLPYEIWNTMKGVWEDAGINTKYITKGDHYGAQYNAWRAANPNAADTSVQAWMDATWTDDGSNSLAAGIPEDESQGPVEIDLNKPPDPADYERTFGIAPAQSASAQLARPTQQITGYSAPGGAKATVFPPNMVLRILEIDGQWARVADPLGYESWVSTTYLQKA
jgi:hypothetical protein